MRSQQAMHSILAILLVAAAAGVTPPPPPPMSCKYDTKQGATYDLTKLQELSQTKAAEVHDRMQAAEKDYLYTFGICSTVAPPANCKKPDGTSRKDPYWAPAWQTNSSQTVDNTPLEERHCAYLGNNDLAENAKWDLLDKSNPGAGVSLTYSKGEHCSNGERRALTLNLKCSRVGIEKFDKNVMDEAAHCRYEISIESEYACPIECGFGGGHAICNNHGVCGYDTDSKAARCFCNEGYAGPGCDAAQESEGLKGYGPILGLLIFVTIALVGLVAAIVGLWRFMSKRTIPIDGDSYARLDNNGEAGGSFAPMRMDVRGPDGL